MRLLPWVAATSVAVLSLAIPGTAYADPDPYDPDTGWASVESDGTLMFIGRGGVDNHITVAPEQFHYVTITDDNYPLFGWPGCINITDHQVRCGYGGAPTRMLIDTRYGNDTIINYLPLDEYYFDKIYGGGGNDVIYGGPGGQFIEGGYSPEEAAQSTSKVDSGEDRLFGGCPDNSCVDGGDHMNGSGGNDLLSGGDGNDRLIGGPGTDVFEPGTGSANSVSYEDRKVPVTVTLNGLADDGQTGEAENVPTGVVVYGGEGNDTLTGGYEDDTLDGWSGHDKLYGSYGYDRLYGGVGNDALYGGDQDDRLYGDLGDDWLLGENGGADRALEYAGNGNDRCVAEYHENCERLT